MALLYHIEALPHCVLKCVKVQISSQHYATNFGEGFPVKLDIPILVHIRHLAV